VSADRLEKLRARIAAGRSGVCVLSEDGHETLPRNVVPEVGEVLLFVNDRGFDQVEVTPAVEGELGWSWGPGHRLRKSKVEREGTLTDANARRYCVRDTPANRAYYVKGVPSIYDETI